MQIWIAFHIYVSIVDVTQEIPKGEELLYGIILCLYCALVVYNHTESYVNYQPKSIASWKP